MTATGARTPYAPASVATPLPPRNPVQTGHTCPATTAAAHPTTSQDSSVTMRATTTARAPLAASSTSTTAANSRPTVRSTFVAPTFRLPVVRRSTPCVRASHSPNDSDPTA